ncbi:tyrosyl-tRNA synthetase-like protein [Zopfia rhizophila CBS 207.26]|uniref:Tyrosine--tRNA ligase n=1 Tax=Zopfia rhizophila CBS 207.26 TaxID=1314779 RepID=A0A6A6EPL7_9PEZI|nr:tyrosyl-tRNA synthetase-like protein [Zopfia rhizophila CBS 207.26]
MPLLRHIPRPGPYICRQCVRKHRGLRETRRTVWAASDWRWKEQAERIKSGQQKGILDILEDRGFVKDVAGGREALERLLIEKPIGVYVGVDPTAPSLHVGHLLPFMALFWMYLHGFYAVTLLGGGTVGIGDPSGRTTARKHQDANVQDMNIRSIDVQLKSLWTHVKALGTKHKYPQEIERKRELLDNSQWLNKLGATKLMRDLGTGMRLRTMLNRDSVKMRMESGDGMSIAEFCYPLFQAFDWWKLYDTYGVQLQIGGSDQYGNICAGMDVVDHMRRGDRRYKDKQAEDDLLQSTFGLTTPLLTTASGEKFGKSAGNAVWLDKDMMSSFDLYQYFLRTSDADVERYLKLFTFLPLDNIYLVMEQQEKDASKRVAQHILAKEVVELAHGAYAAMRAENDHKDAFSQGTTSISLGIVRKQIDSWWSAETPESAKPQEGEAPTTEDQKSSQLAAYKKRYMGSSSTTRVPSTDTKDISNKLVILPKSLVEHGSFPVVLYAAGLASSKSEAHRLIHNQGAYVACPNHGPLENPNELKWAPIQRKGDLSNPAKHLIDWEALVLRSGKSKIQICCVMQDKSFEERGLSCPGWKEFKADLADRIKRKAEMKAD